MKKEKKNGWHIILNTEVVQSWNSIKTNNFHDVEFYKGKGWIIPPLSQLYFFYVLFTWEAKILKMLHRWRPAVFDVFITIPAEDINPIFLPLFLSILF